MKPASCKAKGRSFQNWLCEQIGRYFYLFPPDVKPAMMSESGMDIKLSSAARSIFPYAIEAKNVEKLNVWEAWKQAQTNAEKENLTPLLFIKRNRTAPLMIIDAETGFQILQENARLKNFLREEQ